MNLLALFVGTRLVPTGSKGVGWEQPDRVFQFGWIEFHLLITHVWDAN